jgi:3-hydroxyacyl-CoA dehydrogenase/enoyl-CoA hydratase/3-hydroxybutyryl-CoA epimerase
MSEVFRIERDGDRLELVMDHPLRPLNVFDAAALDALEQVLPDLEQARGVRGMLLSSGKPGSFIAGADVDAIGSLTDAAEVLALVRRAHAAFGRIAALPFPTVAMIDGACLGGGLELALCCDSRVASDEAHTRIGLPEVQLGILPGFGGTSRLPRLVGLVTALDLILSGRTLDGRRAEKAGVIARAVPAAWLREAALARLDAVAQRPAAARRDRWRPRGLGDRLLAGNPVGRALVLRQARASVMARTGGHYPAPLAVIDTVQRSHGRPLADALAHEAEAIAPLVVSPVCKHLVRLFRLSEDAKRRPVVADATLAPAPVATLALAGAGVMGGGIAELASRSGLWVRLRDVRPEALQKGLQTVRAVMRERGRSRRTVARERDAQFTRIQPTLDLSGLSRADAAIEAVVEDLAVKRRVFAELEVRLRPDALLATNTSSLSVDALAEGLLHPGRFVGFHFFNPVHRMPLVEVVRGARTTDVALVTAVALARRLGKTPVVVADAPGFVVNRVLMPYLREALHLLEEGHGVATLDRAMRDFGMPMGPFEVVDEVGLDVAHKVAGVLGEAFPERMAPAPTLATLVAAGRLGRKSGRGFHRHHGRRRRPDPGVRALLGLGPERRGVEPAGLVERMVLAMVNEGARCVEEGVVAHADLVDLAMVFGAGFPPFRGGVLRHADALGLPQVVARLHALAAAHGPRFTPCALLEERAAAGGSLTALPHR